MTSSHPRYTSKIFRRFIIGATLSLGIAFSVIISGTLHYLAHFQNPGFQMVENMLDKAVAAIGMLAFTFAVASLFVFTGSVLNTICAHVVNGLGFSWLMMRTKINVKWSHSRAEFGSPGEIRTPVSGYLKNGRHLCKASSLQSPPCLTTTVGGILAPPPG